MSLTRELTSSSNVWITFCPVVNPWFVISIVLGIPVNEVADVTPATVNDNGLNTAFRLAALYLTVTVVVKPELTSIKTVSLFFKLLTVS